MPRSYHCNTNKMDTAGLAAATPKRTRKPNWSLDEFCHLLRLYKQHLQRMLYWWMLVSEALLAPSLWQKQYQHGLISFTEFSSLSSLRMSLPSWNSLGWCTWTSCCLAMLAYEAEEVCVAVVCAHQHHHRPHSVLLPPIVTHSPHHCCCWPNVAPHLLTFVW